MKLFPTEPLGVVYEDGVPILKRRPLVIYGRLPSWYPYTPEELGYRSIEYLIELDADRCARPWALWVILKTEATLRRALWALMRNLRKRGLIHTRTPYNQCWRWRDLGLGPDPRR